MLYCTTIIRSVVTTECPVGYSLRNSRRYGCGTGAAMPIRAKRILYLVTKLQNKSGQIRTNVRIDSQASSSTNAGNIRPSFPSCIGTVKLDEMDDTPSTERRASRDRWQNFSRSRGYWKSQDIPSPSVPGGRGERLMGNISDHCQRIALKRPPVSDRRRRVGEWASLSRW